MNTSVMRSVVETGSPPEALISDQDVREFFPELGIPDWTGGYPAADAMPGAVPAERPGAGPARSAPRSRRRVRPAQRSKVLGAIVAGALLGGPTRFELGQRFPTPAGGFPVTTLAVNATGAFLLALLLVFVMEVWPPTLYVRPFAGVGFLGAYTTFSTWMVDTAQLLAAGRPGAAALNVLATLFVGLAAVSFGITCGRAVVVSLDGRGRHRRRRAAK